MADKRRLLQSGKGWTTMTRAWLVLWLPIPCQTMDDACTANSFPEWWTTFKWERKWYYCYLTFWQNWGQSALRDILHKNSKRISPTQKKFSTNNQETGKIWGLKSSKCCNGMNWLKEGHKVDKGEHTQIFYLQRFH